jgi:hypothetical protein
LGERALQLLNFDANQEMDSRLRGNDGEIGSKGIMNAAGPLAGMTTLFASTNIRHVIPVQGATFDRSRAQATTLARHPAQAGIHIDPAPAPR